MKSMAMLVAAAGLALAANMSSGLSQEACSKTYLACMNECAERPRVAQDRCMSGCQSQNDRCSSDVYGSRRAADPAEETTDDKPAKRVASPHPHKTTGAKTSGAKTTATKPSDAKTSAAKTSATKISAAKTSAAKAMADPNFDPSTHRTQGAFHPRDVPPPVWNEPEPFAGSKHSNP